VSARNRCQESVDSGRLWFKVKAIGNGDAVMGSQKGHFGPTVPRQGQVETKVFVVCEPGKSDRLASRLSSLPRRGVGLAPAETPGGAHPSHCSAGLNPGCAGPQQSSLAGTRASGSEPRKVTLRR
jgi:hypothetical protein